MIITLIEKKINLNASSSFESHCMYFKFSIYAYTEQLFLTQHERNLLVSKKRKHIYINKIIAHNLDFRGPGV